MRTRTEREKESMHTGNADEEMLLLLLKVNSRHRNLFLLLSPGSVNSIYPYAHGLASGTGHVSLVFPVCGCSRAPLSSNMCPPHPVCTHSHGLCVSLYPFSLSLIGLHHFPSSPDTFLFLPLALSYHLSSCHPSFYIGFC